MERIGLGTGVGEPIAWDGAVERKARVPEAQQGNRGSWVQSPERIWGLRAQDQKESSVAEGPESSEVWSPGRASVSRARESKGLTGLGSGCRQTEGQGSPLGLLGSGSLDISMGLGAGQGLQRPKVRDHSQIPRGSRSPYTKRCKDWG